MEIILMDIERILNTILIMKSGLCALAGIMINRELVTSRFKYSG